MALGLHRNRTAEWATASSSGYWLIHGHPLQLVRVQEGWMLRATYWIGRAQPKPAGVFLVHSRQLGLAEHWTNRQAREWLQAVGLEHVLFPRRCDALAELERLLAQVPPRWQTKPPENRAAE